MLKVYRKKVAQGFMAVSYNTHSTTKETPFKMVYGTCTMFPVEIDTPNGDMNISIRNIMKHGLDTRLT